MNNGLTQHWYYDILLQLGPLLTRGIYLLLASVYAILINISDAKILSDATISNFFAKVQAIVGIFMIFRLTMTILQGLINPDQLTDSKSGAGSVIMKIIVSLVMLTMLIPISNMPNPSNEFEKSIKANGILFGVLYDAQSRILKQDILTKLVLSDEGNYNTKKSLNEMGDNLAIIVLKTFFTPNLKNGVDSKFEMVKGEDGVLRYKDSDLYCDMKDSWNNDLKKKYETYYTATSTGTILNMITEPCEIAKNPERGWDAYGFNYNWLTSLVCSVIFLVVLVLLCIEVAKRAIKLAILRLIAPIPIISYMNPKTNFESGPMGAWVKTLTSTYLELFINLAVIYFVISIIGEISSGGLDLGNSKGAIGLFSNIFIYIALILFAKDAPKFLKQALGIKDEGKGFLGGLGGSIGTMLGVGAAAAGAVGAGIASGRASHMADETNGKKHSPLNLAKNVGAGLVGGVTGFGAGVKTAATSKDHAMKNTFDAIQKRNATALERGANGSTFLGRAGTNATRLFTGQDAYEKELREINKNKAIASTGKDFFSYVEGKAKTDGAGWNVNASYRGANVNTSLDEFHRKKAEAIAKRQRGIGDGTFEIDGQIFAAESGATDKFEQDLMMAAGTEWIVQNQTDIGLQNKLNSYRDAGGVYDIGTSNMDADIKKKYKAAEGNATRLETDARHQQHKADHGATGGK
ncbi:MAG: hypothetical protein E7160_01325 [Firmicutes bacterium]|nr:hypothetical protein [Bacillota bacterium]